MSIAKTNKATGAKRGRKAKPFVTPDDVTINGLNRRSNNGRWRIIGTDIEFTEPDINLAIHKFRMWEAEQQKDGIHLPAGEAQCHELKPLTNLYPKQIVFTAKRGKLEPGKARNVPEDF